MTEVDKYIDGEMARFQEELFEFLRIPSVSARSEHSGDMEKTSRLGCRQDAGSRPGRFYHRNSGAPRGPGRVERGGPRCADPPRLRPLRCSAGRNPWNSGSLPPSSRRCGRGTFSPGEPRTTRVSSSSTSKPWRPGSRTTGTLPVNVVMVAEGEEEIGSPNLVPFVKDEPGPAGLRRRGDFRLLHVRPGIPSLLFSLRGLAYFEIHVQGPGGDLHSGSYGGAVVNPGNTLAHIVDSLKNADGSVAIPGFYDDVMEWDEKTRDAIRALPFDLVGSWTRSGHRA